MLESIIRVMWPLMVPSLSKTVRNALKGLAGTLGDKLVKMAAKTENKWDDQMMEMLVAVASGTPELAEEAKVLFQPFLNELWENAKSTSNPWDNMAIALLAATLEMELEG